VQTNIIVTVHPTQNKMDTKRGQSQRVQGLHACPWWDITLTNACTPLIHAHTSLLSWLSNPPLHSTNGAFSYHLASIHILSRPCTLIHAFTCTSHTKLESRVVRLSYIVAPRSQAFYASSFWSLAVWPGNEASPWLHCTGCACAELWTPCYLARRAVLASSSVHRWSIGSIATVPRCTCTSIVLRWVSSYNT